MIKKLNRQKYIIFSAIMLILYSIINSKVSVISDDYEPIVLIDSLIFFVVGLSVLASFEKNSKITTIFFWFFSISILIYVWISVYSDVSYFIENIRLTTRGIGFIFLAIYSGANQKIKQGKLWLLPVFTECLCSLICIGYCFSLKAYQTVFAVLVFELIKLFGVLLICKVLLFEDVKTEVDNDSDISIDEIKTTYNGKDGVEKNDSSAKELSVEQENKFNINGANKKKKYVKKIIIVFLIVILILLIVAWSVIKLYNNGIIHINYLSSKKYPVKGVDVSNHQGDIDWNVLSKQDISFAFIKSTEGSTFVDKYFQDNWNNAQKAGLRVGAYHFFSFDSPGKKQAELFCNTVKKVDNMLPPVVDVEFYGKYRKAEDIDIVKAKSELRVLIDILEKEYGMKPIIYSGFLYDEMIKYDFEDCDLWYGLIFNPTFDIDGKSAFWQYSQNHVLPGYHGTQKLIDMNVFIGSEEDFATYPDD